MKICPCCTAQLEDEAQFCRNCGAVQPDAEVLFAKPVPEENPFDHTGEFGKEDISENKLQAMLVYLAGLVGVVIALLASKDSPYTKFHIRQGLKFTVIEALLVLAAAIFCWTFIVPIAAAVAAVVLVIIRFICFVRVCKGCAIEPAIIRDIGFLK